MDVVVTEERSFSSESPVCAYWLSRCEGFTVRSGRRVLGVVEEVGCDQPVGRADVLFVRTGHGQTILPAERIEAAVPGQRLLIAASPPRAHRFLRIARELRRRVPPALRAARDTAPALWAALVEPADEPEQAPSRSLSQ